VSGSGISWAIRKSAPSSRQITTPAPHHSVFYRPSNGSLPPGLWLASPSGWLSRTGISSGTLRSVIEYGLPLPFGAKVKVAHTRLPSVRFRSWSRFLTVSLKVTRVIILAVGCHYFPPGPKLPPQPLRGLLSILLLGEQRHNGCEQYA